MKLIEITTNLVIEDRKIADYLLNEAHPEGGSKARFLLRFGFAPERAAELRTCLLYHVSNSEVTDIQTSRFGVLYRITGAFIAPDGRQPHVHAIWEIRTGSDGARLVTLMPVKGRMEMIAEHDRVVLLRDLPDEKLKGGDLGAVVSVYEEGAGYAVEFVSLTGDTVAVVVLEAADVREIREGDMARVREVA